MVNKLPTQATINTSQLVDMWYVVREKPQDMIEMLLTDTQPDTGNKFHWLFLPGQRSTAALYDTIIQETRNFVVLPTKGSIVPGWVLVVPKFPATRMADIPPEMNGELNDLVRRLTREIMIKFGMPYFFEHGGFKGSKVSCGVDQAHLHIAPLSFNLIRAAQYESPGQWKPARPDQLPLGEFTTNEYWFVSSGDNAVFKTVERPSSQFFRKIIAREVGKPKHWDYNLDDFTENVAITLRTIGANV